MKVIYNMEPREEALSKDPQMDLAATILFIEATEAGNDRLVSCLEALQPAVGPTIQFWWQKTTNKALPEVNAADTVEETDTGDLLMGISGRKLVLLGTNNVPNATRRATLRSVAIVERVRRKSLQLSPVLK